MSGGRFSLLNEGSDNSSRAEVSLIPVMKTFLILI